MTTVEETRLWDEYVAVAKGYVAKGTIEEEELNYKREMGRDLSIACEALLTGQASWLGHLEQGLRNRVGLTANWRVRNSFLSWCGAEPQIASNALASLWNQEDLPIASKIRSFTAHLSDDVRRHGIGTVTSLIATLLLGSDIENTPPFNTRPINRAYDRTGYDKPPSDMDEAARYEHALRFFDRFVREARKRDLEFPSRLYAQSIIYALHGGRSDNYENYLRQLREIIGNGVMQNTVRSLESLAAKLYLPADFLKNIVTLLEEKKQVIFQGPPGTGKTYVAQELAEHLAGSSERVTLVQFHPSYSYEDFVQGYRPTLNENGQPAFALRDGPLLKAAERARNDPANRHFLIIDEINRGNIANVFGELYFLLEYRDREITLQYGDEDFRLRLSHYMEDRPRNLYSDQQFSLPPNLYIIGTMNTADRSIALVDLALRRRFYFVEFHPDNDPIDGVLRRYLNDNRPDMTWVADIVDRTNQLLRDDRHAAIGPSYFMKENLDEEMVKRIWQHSVNPYIEERRFQGDSVSADFRLDGLRRAVTDVDDNEQVGENSPAGGDTT